MGAFGDLNAQFDPHDNDRKGDQFEIVCKWFLENDPIYKSLFKRVWLWDDWPGYWPIEAGIDLVAEDRDNKLWAIQAKAIQETDQVTHSGVSNFLAESGRAIFSNLMLIATTDRIHFIGERTMKEVDKKPVIVRLRDLDSAEVDWPASLADLHPAPQKDPKKPHPHQQEAIDEVVRGFAEADRGQLIMACGTGKTLTALFIKEKMGAQRTLVLVPSLSLLQQTLREWMANKTTDFDFLAVCSDDSVSKPDRYDAALLHTTSLGVPSVTDPGEIASFLRRRSPSVVFATYQSSPKIAEAFTLGGIPAFDFVIADEAHRCAGRVGTDFTTVLDNEAIKATKRLFMTATPRRYTHRIQDMAKARDFEVASMDDEATFGKMFHRLGFAEAIERKLLTDYRVLVVGVDNATYLRWAQNGRFVTRDGTTIEDARSLAGQIGLAKAMKEYDLRRAISFHNLIASAHDFAEAMPDVVAWMPAEERPTGELVSRHVSGSLSAGKRHAILQRLSKLEPSERGLVTNARCLSEGVDVPTLDCVAFIEPRRSEVDIVQAVGRAIRKSDDKKTGTIVIPVFIDADEDPEIALESSDFDSVWDVVKALRAHDDELGKQLDELRWELGRRGGRVKIPPKIRFLLPAAVSGKFVNAFEARLVVETTTSWQFWYGLMQRFIDEKGHGRVAALYKTEDGYTLGRWVNKQRASYQDGELPDERVHLLEALGPKWSWDARGDRWNEGFARLLDYVEENDTALVPDGYKSPDGFALGKWLGNQRTAFSKDKLSAEYVARLEEVHPSWSWNTKVGQWQIGIDHLTAFLAEHGHLRVTQKYRSPDGFPLGSWVSGQRIKRQKDELDIALQQQLELLHSTWSWQVRADVWEESLEALIQYVKEHDHARVPSTYRTASGLGLGSWVAHQRVRRSKGDLTAEEQQRLEAVHSTWSWDPNTDKWEQGFNHLLAFIAEYGHARVPATHKTSDGYRLGHWVSNQRSFLRRDQLTAERKGRLDAVHETWTWDALLEKWEAAYQCLCEYVEEHGDADVIQDYVAGNGVQLGVWVARQRRLYKKGDLDQDRVAKLNAVPGWVWNPPLGKRRRS